MKTLAVLFLTAIISTCHSQYDPVISSSWSMWSPWSFCSNNVMIRVRACSTVRGYKCVGHNKEFQSCNSPPKRNNMDYEDSETIEREMAMKQLYQDYEPEIPDEEKYISTTRENTNFHHIPTTTTHFPQDFDLSTKSALIGSREREEFDDGLEAKPSENPDMTFGIQDFPSSPITTTQTIEDTTFSTVPTENHEPGEERKEEDVRFTGNYDLEVSEEPTPLVSLPTTVEVGPPGTEITPTSFPIVVTEDQDQRVISDSNSYAIGKEPDFNGEPLGDLENETTSEVSQSVIPTMPEEEERVENVEKPRILEENFETASSEETTTIMSTTVRIENEPKPVISLRTSQQNLQHFPKFMNEQRAPPGNLVPTIPTYIRTIQTPREITPTNDPHLTVEITKKPLKKKKRVRRIKKLNRMGRKRIITVVPTENTMVKKSTVEENNETPSDKFLVPKLKVNSSEIPHWANEQDRKVLEETKELEARLIALKHRVDRNKRLLESIGSPKMAESKEEVLVEGDTARALSWMINDMERMVDDKTDTFVADTIPIERVDESKEGFRIGETDDSVTTESPFPFPVGDGFSLIRSKRSTYRGKVLWSPWSEWTNCNCGKQSRKRKCFKNIGKKVNTYDNYNFIPIKNDNSITEFGESAPYPESVQEPEPIDSQERQNRVKRSIKCPPPQIEVRYCESTICLI